MRDLGTDIAGIRQEGDGLLLGSLGLFCVDGSTKSNVMSVCRWRGSYGLLEAARILAQEKFLRSI